MGTERPVQDGRGRVRDGVLGLDKVRDKLLADLTEERVEGEDLRNCIFETGSTASHNPPSVHFK